MNKDVRESMFNEIYDIAYEKAYVEAYKSVMSFKEKEKERNDLAIDLYNGVSYEDVERLIRKDLPLRVKLFNKVSVTGKLLICEKLIIYTYCFNDNKSKMFHYMPTLDELKETTSYILYKI